MFFFNISCKLIDVAVTDQEWLNNQQRERQQGSDKIVDHMKFPKRIKVVTLE